uniref:Xylanase inhibitor C-terminal domain-containing protein n=1 Tax=Salix viminalis TaxID=40686 RepID=A0A6N2LLS2_SALVM
MGSTRVGPAVPQIDLVLQNSGVFWRIFGANSMVQGKSDVLCLGFVDGGLEGSPTKLGRSPTLLAWAGPSAGRVQAQPKSSLKTKELPTDHQDSFNGRCRWVEEFEVVLPVVVASEMMAYGGWRQRWKVALLFTDHDESFNGRCLWVEEDEMVLPHSSVSFVTEEAATVVASQIANRSQEKHEFVAYYKMQFRLFLWWDPLQFSAAYCVTKHCSADYRSKRRCNHNAKRAPRD